MRRSLLIGTCGAALLAAAPFFSSAGEAMVQKVANEVSRLTRHGSIETVKSEETEFGRRLLETWKRNGVELPMPEEQILRLRKGVEKLSAQPEVQLPSNMRFTGFLQYSNVDGEINLPYGFYTFSQKDGLTRSLYQNLEACVNMGGAYVGNRFYGVSSIDLTDDSGVSRVYLYEWDSDTWKSMIDPVKNPNLTMGGGVDVDPLTNKVYGIDNGSRVLLKTLDYAARTSTDVGDLSSVISSVSAFAISNDGIGYIVSESGELYKVNLETAQTEKVGNLDFTMYSALQSMTFDRRTNKLYLAVSERDPDSSGFYGRLCEVNLTDATTKLVGYFPEAEEYTVLHVVYDPEAGAPGNITDLKAEYADASGNGVVSFTVPSVTFGGSPLTGSVNYSVYVNDNETPVATGTASAGQKVTANVTAAEGRTKYVVVLSNQAGEGERNAIESWGGEDTPAVTNVTTVQTGNNVTLSWETGGANGGYADFDGMTYDIYRFPGPTCVAEGLAGNSFTDDLTGEPNGAFVYSVTPVRNGRYFQAFKTAPVFGGTPRELPYSQDFETKNAEYEFMLLNNHDLGWKIAPNWELEGVMWYTSSPYVDADSWALTPELKMEEGNTYVIDFKMSKISARFSEYLGAGIGIGIDPSTYETIMDRTEVTSMAWEEGENVHLVYVCKKTGAYHFGFHAMSPRNQSAVFIHELSIEKGLPVTVPEAPADVTAVPGANGDLTASVSFTAPSRTVGGTALNKITKATLYREGTDEPVAELTNVTPGQKYTIVDDDAMNGRLTYTVTTWNEFGEGAGASASVYVGIDIPKAPRNISVKDNLDGSFTLNWDMDTEGVNGGLVDLDELTYNIYYYDDGSMINYAENVEGTTFTIRGLRTSGSQAFFFPAVSAVNDLGESEVVDTPVVTIGTAYTVPFMEGFQSLSGIWCPEGDGTVSWSLYSGMSVDDDNFLMGARAKDYNAVGALRSGKFSVKGVEHPKLAFSFFGAPGYDNTLTVYINREGGTDEKLLEIPFKTLEGGAGWRTCLVDLDDYKNAAYINIVFGVRFDDDSDEGDFIYFDDVNVRDVPAHNLAVQVLPQNRVTAGEDARIDVRLHNIGTSVENNSKVEIYVNDVLHTTLASPELNPFDRAKLSNIFPVAIVAPELTRVKAVLVNSDDSMEEDNTSVATMKVFAPLFESASNLTAEEAGDKVTLNWDAPEDSAVATESFEGYESFKYDGFGDWTVYDGDGANTMSAVSVYFPGRNNPAAFFTVDFGSLGYDMKENPDFAGHTGDAYIACMIPNTLTNNDWVISPELSGNAQTISLYAKSLGAILGEKFEILYSEGSTNPDDFVALGTIYEPGETWEEYSAEIPAGAKYFAIHCTSRYGGMLMIDDVTFEPAARELIGYKVYRNDELIATLGADKLTYTEDAPKGEISYKVTALYKNGESAPCEKVVTLSVVNIGAAGASVTAANGMIVISGAEGEEVNVTALDGKTIYNGVAASTVKVPVDNGVYMVTIGKRTVKILVP